MPGQLPGSFWGLGPGMYANPMQQTGVPFQGVYPQNPAYVQQGAEGVPMGYFVSPGSYPLQQMAQSMWLPQGAQQGLQQGFRASQGLDYASQAFSAQRASQVTQLCDSLRRRNGILSVIAATKQRAIV